MRSFAVVLAVVVSGSLAAAATPAPRIPGAKAYSACAAAGPFWPTQTVAVERGEAWVACKEEERVVRVPLTSGRRRTVAVGGQPIAILSALGAVWVLDTGGTVTRLDAATGRVLARISTSASRPYNLWAGAGALWLVDDSAGALLRVDATRRRVVARIAVGDGPSDIVFDGDRAWVINHRDRGLVLVDTQANRARRLATIPGDAPERIARAAGRLWITGRGTDLLRVDPVSGRVEETIEIGAGGIDVVASGGAVWVPTRGAAADRRGFPTMAALRRVDPESGTVSSRSAARRVDVHGLASYARGVLLADNTSGLLHVVR